MLKDKGYQSIACPEIIMSEKEKHKIETYSEAKKSFFKVFQKIPLKCS